jgi:hypothetical protein
MENIILFILKIFFYFIVDFGMEDLWNFKGKIKVDGGLTRSDFLMQF